MARLAPVWTWAVGPWQASDPTRELTKATSRKLMFRRRGPASCSFKIDGLHPEAAEIAELETDVHVWRANTDGEPKKKILRARVGPTGDDVAGGRHVVDVSAGDYRARLERRKLLDGDPLGPHIGSDVGTLVWLAVNTVQLRPGGDEGITQGVGFPAGAMALDTTWTAGQSVARAIDTLSDVPVEYGGFDWEIAADRKVNLFLPKRGEARGSLELGGAVVGLKRRVDPSAFSNVVRFSGDAAVGSSTFALADIATRPEGRWEDQIADPDARTTPVKNARGRDELARRSRITRSFELTLRRGFWRGPGHLWLGDSIILRARSGRLSEIETLEIDAVEIEVHDDGGETVKITVGDILENALEKLAGARRRLRDLERT